MIRRGLSLSLTLALAFGAPLRSFAQVFAPAARPLPATFAGTPAPAWELGSLDAAPAPENLSALGLDVRTQPLDARLGPVSAVRPLARPGLRAAPEGDKPEGAPAAKSRTILDRLLGRNKPKPTDELPPAVRHAAEIGTALADLEASDPDAARRALDSRWDRRADGTYVLTEEADGSVAAPGASSQGRSAPQAGADAPAYRPAVRILTTAAAVAGLDLLARSALPALFGFSGPAAVWTTIGLGAVLGPVLVYARAKLSKDASVVPLKKSFDRLLGVVLGAAIVTAASIAPAELATALLEPFKTLTVSGKVGLAPLLGAFALVSGIPHAVFAGQIQYGLKKQKFIQELALPLQPLFKLFLLPLVLSPLALFGGLTGGPIAGMSLLLSFWGLITYNSAKGKLSRLTFFNLSEAQRQRVIAKAMAEKAREAGAAAPESAALPALGRGFEVRGRAAAAVPQPARQGWISIARLAALAAGTVGLVLLQSTLAGTALPSFWPVLKSFAMFMPLLVVAPYIMVFFSKGKRTTSGPLYDVVKELSEKGKMKTPPVYVVGWKDPNAFATGFLKSISLVAATKPILAMLTVAELRGVMAHELSHVRFRHMLYFLPALLLLQWMPNGAVNLAGAALAFWAPLAWTIAFSAMSRSNERQADHGGAALSGDPASLAAALRKLAIYGTLKSGVAPGHANGVYNALTSHPPVLERIETLSKMATGPSAK